MMNNFGKYLTMIGAWSLLSLAPVSASGVFPFNTVHSGGTPGGSPDWATMTITNISGGVTITLTHLTTDLISEPNRFISQLNLKFNTAPSSATWNSGLYPYLQNISIIPGGFTDAGLTFNVKVDFRTAGPPGT